MLPDLLVAVRLVRVRQPQVEDGLPDDQGGVLGLAVHLERFIANPELGRGGLLTLALGATSRTRAIPFGSTIATDSACCTRKKRRLQKLNAVAAPMEAIPK